MKYVAGFLVLASWFYYHPTFAAEPSSERSCECPKLACDSCSVERGITFFTEKCGPMDSKRSSCARPTCIPIDEATKECPVPPTAGSGPREPVVVQAAGGVLKEAAEGSNERPVAGRVKVIQGAVSIVRADGRKIVVSSERSANRDMNRDRDKDKDTEVHEGDTISSDKDGAVVTFHGGNKMHVAPDSQVEIKEFKNQQSPQQRKALLNLIKGKIRNQVEQKYNGKTSYFKVTTKGAVAGVRGTDFVVSHSEDGKLETRVETLSGKVVLANLDDTSKREVVRGEGAVLTAALSKESELEAGLVSHGVISEIYKLSAEEMSAIDQASRMDIVHRRVPASEARAKKAPAPVDPSICSQPKGRFNQCHWKCEGNPSGESTCRLDLPQVRCVRSRCNANGSWAEETRLPASVGQHACPATGAKVTACDY